MECKKETKRAEKKRYNQRKRKKYSEPQSTRYEASAKERIEPTGEVLYPNWENPTLKRIRAQFGDQVDEKYLRSLTK